MFFNYYIIKKKKIVYLKMETPYYRSLTPIHASGCDDLPDSNYGPYDLFCLRTRLYPIVYQMFGRDVEIVFRSEHKNSRMELKIDIVYIREVSELTGPETNPSIIMNDNDKQIIERSIKTIVSKHISYCLIDKKELYLSAGLSPLGNNYPKDWFYNVLGYIEIPTEYNPFLQQNGIYLTFNEKSDYIRAYNDVVNHILKTIEKYYKEGVVYGAGNIAEKWKLERMDYEEVVGKLYKPVWTDKRLSHYPVDFLLGKISGDTSVRVDINDTLSSRHNIAKVLNKNKISFVFDGSTVVFNVDNLDDAQYILALITSANIDTNEKVIAYSSVNASVIHLYMKEAKELLENSNCLGYQTTSIDRPYVFSCIVKNVNGDRLLERIGDNVIKKIKL